MNSALTLRDRAAFYAVAFPQWPSSVPRADDRWLDAMWVLGNNYRGSGLYGAYPPNYLRRVMALFPDATEVLHLFAGSLERVESETVFHPPETTPMGTRHFSYFDREDGDAHELAVHYPAQRFDLILADPPYSAEDAEHYGTPMVNRNHVLAQCSLCLELGGFVVWLDQVLPMFRKSELHLCGLIGIVRSTNHRFRVASIFQKVGGA